MTAEQFRNTADDFTKAYVEAALWSSSAEIGECERCGAENVSENHDNNGNPCEGRVRGTDLSFQDRGFDIEDIAPETLDAIVSDCARFYTAHGHLFTEETCNYRGCSVDKYAGHDFWLNRCGHGCGYWDGNWEEPAATQLDEAAKASGNVDLYLGDDGKIYA